MPLAGATSGSPATRPSVGKRWVLGGLLVLALMAALVVGGTRLARRSERRDALQLVRQGEFAKAEPMLHHALDRQPDDVDVLKALAQGELSTEKLDEAETHLDRWCDLRPGETEPFRRRIDLWLRLKRVPEAIADARHLLELDPDNDFIRQQLSQWLLMTGQLEDAEAQCRRCLQRQPGQPELRNRLATVYHEMGDNARAESLVEELLQQHPRLPAARLLRAILYDEAGDATKAIAILRQVIAEEPGYRLSARYYLSQALAHAGQTEEARRVAAEMQRQRAVDLWSGRGHLANWALELRMAEGLLAVGQSDEAIQTLNTILQKEPHCAAAHQLLASYYEKQGQAEQAADHRRQAEQ
jgi:predicted Zn-dependent protease